MGATAPFEWKWQDKTSFFWKTSEGRQANEKAIRIDFGGAHRAKWTVNESNQGKT